MRKLLLAGTVVLFAIVPGVAQMDTQRFKPLTPETMTPEQKQIADKIMAGPRKGMRGPFSALLRSPELADYAQKLGEYVPHVIAFNGKNVYEQFAQRRAKLGLQKESLYGAKVYVLPATDSQHAQKPKERLVHFRKLAALVRKVETSRDAKPL